MKRPHVFIIGIILFLMWPLLSSDSLGSMEVCFIGAYECPENRSIPPTVPLPVADFDKCTGENNLGGEMAPASPDAQNRLTVEYPQLFRGNCVAQIAYQIDKWAAYWLILKDEDFTPYNHLTFDIKSDSEQIMPQSFKVEIKDLSGRIELIYVEDIKLEWQTVEIHIPDFVPPPGGDYISDSHINEIVFVFETAHSGNEGVILIDNIRLTP